MAFLNGEFLEREAATVSVDDRGFQFGDGVYEVVKTYEGRPFALTEHLLRLRKGAKALGFELPIGIQALEAAANELARRSGLPEAELYFQATRGPAPRSHAFPREVKPTVLITARPVRPIPRKTRELGATAVTTPDTRWGWCHLKTLQLLPNVLAKQQAVEAGAYEAIFVRGGDMISEGASSNVFVWRESRLITPPIDNILPGVTREVAISLAREMGLSVSEVPVSLSDLAHANEAFLTSTVSEIMPLVMVDDIKIGPGTPGPVTSELYRRFIARVRETLGLDEAGKGHEDADQGRSVSRIAGGK